ncbi:MULTISPECIES: YlbG family protein [unclassified Granulicatella]|uniref:YlbG family protein n=1 Tax=unclassified Granulicatella TaxID=2630493 RepID=UPI0010731E3C|nr:MULTISPECIES: YlbG family protein [unclassified Granulicatella]MBF0780065.1 YlbG family protein [Granulicatella sp. 19428wC4_WM01]TFU95851.1 DUF2129 domain-containing protein [Granulicatella sp. WM01]
MEKVQRIGLIVWVYSLKNLTKLNRFGDIHYISKRMNYVSLYVNDTNLEQVMKQIKGLHFVRFVEKSYFSDIDMSFKHALESDEIKQEG